MNKIFSFFQSSYEKENKNNNGKYNDEEEEKFYEACDFVTQQFEIAKNQYCNQCYWKTAETKSKLTIIEREDILNGVYKKIIDKLEEGIPQYIDKILFLKKQWNDEYNENQIIIKDFLIL